MSCIVASTIVVSLPVGTAPPGVGVLSLHKESTQRNFSRLKFWQGCSSVSLRAKQDAADLLFPKFYILKKYRWQLFCYSFASTELLNQPPCQNTAGCHPPLTAVRARGINYWAIPQSD